MCFTPSSDEIVANEDEMERKDKMKLSFNYKRLNDSYNSREIPLSNDFFQSYFEEELKKKPILDELPVSNRNFYQMHYYKTLKHLDDERMIRSVEKDNILCKISKFEKEILNTTGNSTSSSRSSSNQNVS